MQLFWILLSLDCLELGLFGAQIVWSGLFEAWIVWSSDCLELGLFGDCLELGLFGVDCLELGCVSQAIPLQLKPCCINLELKEQVCFINLLHFQKDA